MSCIEKGCSKNAVELDDSKGQEEKKILFKDFPLCLEV